MSTKSKKNASKGVRYSDAKKREVVEFVKNHDAKNGRGGQSAASRKFGVTPLTISAWLKAAGAGKKKAAKKVAKKAAKKAAKKGPKIVSASRSRATGKSRGTRYSEAEKQEIVDFVNSYNAENGRGGQSAAVRKFQLSAITVSAWLKRAGIRPGGRTAKMVRAGVAPNVPAVSPAVASKVKALLDVSEEIRRAEVELAKLRAKYDALSVTIRSSI